MRALKMNRWFVGLALVSAVVLASACEDSSDGGGGGGGSDAGSSADRGGGSGDGGGGTDTGGGLRVDTGSPPGGDTGSTPDVPVQDTGPPAEACGDLTFQGECSQDVVRWCDTESDTAQEVDCSTFYGEGVDAVCEEISESFGFWCSVAEGGPCLFQIEEDVVPASCEDGGICALDAEGATCVAADGLTCTADDEGACVDGLHVLLCDPETGLFIGWACSTECTDTGCAGQLEGDPCTPDEEGDVVLTCAEGLTCGEESGVCEAS